MPGKIEDPNINKIDVKIGEEAYNPIHSQKQNDGLELDEIDLGINDAVDLKHFPNIADNTIKNAGRINDVMRFSSENAANAFTAISNILNGEGNNEEKIKLIAEEQDKVGDDTTLQVFANMARGMLGSSKQENLDEKEVEGIEKLSEAFAFLGHKIDDTDEPEKQKRLEDMVGAYASLMNDKDLDKDTKKSIETAFNETPDIAKIAQIQEGVENKDPQKLEEAKKTIPINTEDDLKDPSTYDGKNWEDFKSKAIYGAKGAIAIGLLFAPGGIFLAPLFLWATKNWGNPDEVEKEQKDAEAAGLESEKALEFLNAYKKYLPDPKEVNQNEGEERKKDSELVEKKTIDKTTAVGEEAKKFVQKENDSLGRTQGTLQTNHEALERVEEVKNTAVSVVDETTKAALASIIGGLGGTKMEEKHKDETTGHGVTAQPVGGAVRTS